MVGTGHGQVAGMVAQAILLLVGAVVLLVDDDHPGMSQGGKDGRAGAQYDRRPAACRGLPGIEALVVGEPRVQGYNRCPEAASKAGEGLRCQADLGDQHQGLAATGDDRLDQLQIDLGLAAAGDAMQQAGVETVEALVDGGQRRGLFAVEGHGGLGQPGLALGRRRGRQGFLVTCHQALAGQGTQLVAAERLGENRLADQPVGVLAQHGQQLGLAGRAAQARRCLSVAGRGHAPALAGTRLECPALTQQPRHGLVQGIAQCMLVISGREAAKPQPVRRQRGRIEAAGHRPEIR